MSAIDPVGMIESLRRRVDNQRVTIQQLSVRVEKAERSARDASRLAEGRKREIRRLEALLKSSGLHTDGKK